VTPSPPPTTHSEGEFVRLYTANARRVYTYILTLLPSRADAEDVFQDVGALLWDKFASFEPGTHFGAWACRIAFYRVLKHRVEEMRRPRVFGDVTLETIMAEMETTEASLDLDAEYRLLTECLAALPEADRRLIENRYAPEGAPRQLAAALNWPVKKVYKALDRIRKVLLGCVTRKIGEGSNA